MPEKNLLEQKKSNLMKALNRQGQTKHGSRRVM